MFRKQRDGGVEGRVLQRREFREPGQVREEAALSDASRVLRGGPTGAVVAKSSGFWSSDGGVHTFRRDGRADEGDSLENC